MKGYKFNLETLLRIRKIKEDLCKQEIGRLQIQKKEYEETLKKFSHELDEMYDAQEQTLEEGASGQQSRFFPFFFEGKRAHVDVINKELTQLEEHIAIKFKELSQHRANVKVLEKMKEKDKYQYKRKLEKKQAQEVEENVQNWKLALKG
jgi:flagellar export protein FliJ